MHEIISPFGCLNQATKNALSAPNKEPTEKQNEVEKLEIREQNKTKTEAKWKYKVWLLLSCDSTVDSIQCWAVRIENILDIHK